VATQIPSKLECPSTIVERICKRRVLLTVCSSSTCRRSSLLMRRPQLPSPARLDHVQEELQINRDGGDVGGGPLANHSRSLPVHRPVADPDRQQCSNSLAQMAMTQKADNHDASRLPNVSGNQPTDTRLCYMLYFPIARTTSGIRIQEMIKTRRSYALHTSLDSGAIQREYSDNNFLS
jgi:hypothetical protein